MLKAMRVVVLFSRGVDSAVTAGLLAREGAEVHLLFVNYGQRAAPGEERCAHVLADYMALPLTCVDVAGVACLGQGSLFASHPGPGDGPGETYFPHRNLLLLTIGAQFARRLDCNALAVGFIKPQGSYYPDTTPEFLRRVRHVLTLESASFQLLAPLIEYDKTAVVRLAENLGVPWRLAHSCDLSAAGRCGKCPSCLDLEYAIRGVGR